MENKAYARTQSYNKNVNVCLYESPNLDGFLNPQHTKGYLMEILVAKAGAWSNAAVMINTF